MPSMSEDDKDVFIEFQVMSQNTTKEKGKKWNMMEKNKIKS